MKNNETSSITMGNEDHGSTSTSETASKSSIGEYLSLSSNSEFALLSFCMFFLFGVHNILQEAIMKVPDFQHGIMLGYFEVFGVTLCSFLERRVKKETGHVAPLSQYTILTLCLLASSGFSNMSLDYINFPTKVVFRSCKLLPTMLISTIINRRIFSSIEYICAFVISGGLILFAAADWKLTPSFNPLGIMLVLLSVVADAILPNAQERLFNLKSSRLEVTLYTNFFTLIVMTITTTLSGDLPAVLKHAASNSQLACYLTVYTLIAYAAISTFMIIVKKYGGVTAVLLGTARKAMTIVLSFLIFPKEFSWMYVAGTACVLGGLTTISLVKQYRKADSHEPEKCETQPMIEKHIESDRNK